MKNRGKKNFITTVSGLNNFSKEKVIQTSTQRTSLRNAAKNLQYHVQQSSWEQFSFKETTLII